MTEHSEQLDERTEQAIMHLMHHCNEVAFAPRIYGAFAEACVGREAALVALRNRIRELVEEARREGYQSDKPYFLNRLPKDAYSLELPPDD